MEFSRRRALLLCMLGAGLALRIAAVVLFTPPLFSDDTDYVALGKSLSHAGAYELEGHATAYRPPGYPLLLAASFTLFGDSLVPVRIAQSFADMISCFLVFALGKRLFSERVGLIGAGIFAFFPVQILYVSILMTETVFTTLLLLYLYICTGRHDSWRMSVLEGLVLGAGTLVRPTILLIPAALFVVRWMYGWTRTENLRALAITGAATLIIVSPWLIRNYYAFGRISLTSNTGVNFWMGSHSGASGSYSFPADNPLASATDEFKRTDLGTRLGIEFIRDHPLEYAMLIPKKWAHFFSVDYWLLLAMHYQPDFHTAPNAATVFSRFPLRDVLALQIPFAAVILLAAFGISCHARGDSQSVAFLMAPCAYWILVHLVFYAAARYRFPVVPLFMIGGAYGVDIIMRKSYVMSRGRIAAFSLLALLFVAGWTAERVIIQKEARTSAQSTLRALTPKSTLSFTQPKNSCCSSTGFSFR
jgi:4-amino-4-deoxy-L-arabinose transferase-like glycosyltransferase